MFNNGKNASFTPQGQDEGRHKKGKAKKKCPPENSPPKVGKTRLVDNYKEKSMKMKYDLIKNAALSKGTAKSVIKTVMKDNLRASQDKSSEMYKTSVFEELGRTIKENPMVSTQDHLALQDEEQARKIKIFKMYSKKKSNLQNSMEPVFKNRDQEDKVIKLLPKPQSKNKTK